MIRKAVASILAIAATLASIDARAADVKMICASGMREAVSALLPLLERTAGRHVIVSFGEAGDLSRRIQAGESADVIVLPRTVMDQVLARGDIAPGSVSDLAQSEIGIGIRKDTQKPDIASADGLKRALLAAKSIAATDPASGGVAGVYVAEVFQRLGIAEQLKPKLILTRGQRNAEYVARGEAQIAVQLSNEIRAVAGIEFIPLPAEFRRIFVFSAGLGSKAKEVEASRAMLQFLSGPEAIQIMRAKGLDPAEPR